MYYRATKGVAVAVLLTIRLVLSLQSGQALAADAIGHIDQLKAQVLKPEAASNEQSGMMKYMVVLQRAALSGTVGSMDGNRPDTKPKASGMRDV